MHNNDRKLLQLSYNIGATIAIGRLGDNTSDIFTFCTTNCQGIVDFLLISPDNNNILSDFNVFDFTEFLVHVPVVFDLKTSANSLLKMHRYI